VLEFPDYLRGVLELVAAVGAAGLGATRVRARLLPGWSGPPALVADSLLAIALLIWVAELLGAFGALREAPYFASCVAAGLAVRVLVAPAREGQAAGPPAPPCGRLATMLALAVAAVVFAHWSIGTRAELGHGMTGYDTLWYHEPFAVHFAEGGSTWALDFIAPRYQTWFYPANSELTHAIGILALQRDLLSPLFNMLWLGGTLLAAWSIGRPYGVAPASLLAVCLLLDSGVMADQAGSGRNDTIGVFFLLGAAALLVNGRAAAPGRPLPAGTLAVAGLGVGLAAGVKLTLLAPAAVLTAAVTLISASGRRARSAAAFGLPLLAGCGFWYLRNLVQAASPLPWVHSLGPLSLPGPDQALGGRPQSSVLDYLGDGSVIQDWFLPGLHRGLGVLWPLVLALAVAGIALHLGRRSDAMLRGIAATALTGVLAWFVLGTSAEGDPGAPVGFFSGLRHLAPSLALGLVLLPLVPALRSSGASSALVAGLLVLVPLADASGGPWRAELLPGAIAAGALCFGALVAIPALLALGPPRRAVAAGAAGALVLALGAGWYQSRDFLEHRYEGRIVNLAGLNRAFDHALDLRDERIAVVGNRIYPLYGNDLSNEVEYVGAHRPQAGFFDIGSCPSWRRNLNRGRFDYVVLSYDSAGEGPGRYPPQVAWTADDRSAHPLFRLQPTAMFRLDGPLDPSGCAAGRRG
jgi:hypothetical protein